MKRLRIVFHGRFPGEKAGSLFAGKSAEAFAALGIEVELIAPLRLDRVRQTPAEYWGMQDNFRVRYLPIIDLFSVPLLRQIAFFVSIATYLPAVFFYILFTRRAGDVIYSNEAFPLLPASFIAPAVYELHDFPERMFWVYRILLRRAALIVSTNNWKRDALIRRFDVPKDRIVVERNAVDIDALDAISKTAACTKLRLDPEARYVVYTGQFYPWKGTDTLAEAAKLVPDAQFVFVGGVDVDFARSKARWAQAKNIRFTGQVPHGEAALWQKAADVLVVPNTAKEEISAHYTSPMKLFEYMASGNPIVASDIPSIREVVDESLVYFARPDNAASLAQAIEKALSDPLAVERAQRASTLVREHTWGARAQRIRAAIEAHSSV